MTKEDAKKIIEGDISIHILHTKDDSDVVTADIRLEFQSTSFTRRMTVSVQYPTGRTAISIHILHTKDDESLSEMWAHT